MLTEARRGESHQLRGKSPVDDTWYSAFAQILFQDVPHSQVNGVFDGISIVCFNYDRCIEHYLTCELMREVSTLNKEMPPNW